MFTKFGKICGSNFSNWENIRWHVSKNLLFSDYVISSVQKYPNFLKYGNNRSYSTVYNVIPQPRKTASENERQEFVSLFPQIVKDLTEPYTDIPEVTQRYADVLESNVPNHKQASGLVVVTAYKMLEHANNLTPENIRLANILGWCVDLLLCSYQIHDDIMDSSDTRRGIPCWYKNDGVGMQAVNDAVLIENGTYLIVKKYFSDHHCYVPSVEWLHEVTVKTTMGQSLDTMCKVNGKPDLQSFTAKRLRSLAKYKGAYPEFLLPVILSMYLANMYDTQQHRQVKNILIELGDYFTAQNDILDCFGDSSITGKVGSDIREGKCTWLVVTALGRATAAQRKLLEEHYGRSGHESEFKVRTLYNELGVLDTFLKYEEESFNNICKHIEQMSKNLPPELFFKIVNTTYGRYER